MASEIVELKLPDFDLTTVPCSETGVDPEVVARACEGLESHAKSLTGFVTNLCDEKDRLVNGWSGEAADMLNSMFPELIDAFSEVPGCVQSIADWATSYTNAIVEIDKLTTDNFGLLGGRN